MESDTTELYLPSSFPYPIKVVSVDADTSTSIERGTRLLSYSFVHLPSTAGVQPETRFGTWDSAIEGKVESWKVKRGDVISQQKAVENPVVRVREPCKHGMQIGGLCVYCGKDMTNSDYIGFSDASRASIQMTHSAFGPTVSLEEAQRIERETAEHLLNSRKLSLIVDLDQTVVHATVDPTVGEWIAEGEAWEATQAKKASSSKMHSDSSDDSSSDSENECNPNWEALKDVKKFRLGPESFGGPSPRGFQKGKGKNKLLENEGCMYYIKPRPGWRDFLRNIALKYEMHVYTMGTRAYAEEVCAAIDPDGSIFGGRVLSRDESGSLTQKSLQRLFPCDTSMVVIIDDRADVWEWSPNLIKVVPYDFFVGIGDINSTFLPKIEPLAISTQPPGKSIASHPSSSSGSQPSVETSPSPEESERAELTTNAMLTQNSLALEAQLEQRPLAKKQEALQVASEASFGEEQQSGAEQKSDMDMKDTEDGASTSSKSEKAVRKALLKNDDFELERVSKLLNDVHRRFFRAYDARSALDPNQCKSGSVRPREPSKVPYDVTRIIPQIRSEALAGVQILFSSVIPLDTRADTTEIWRMAHMFGAKCSTELTSDVTHVVAAKRGTVKVDAARKRGGIKIVWLSWFTDSIALWRRQDETSYLLDDPPAAGSTLDRNRISSVAGPDGEDWDKERVENTTSLELDKIDWNDANDEVEAAMNESDDEDERSDRSGMRSENVSEDDWSDETNSIISTPKLKRKRLRSLTPLEMGVNGDSNVQDVFRSPLAKRKKLAADRTGYSKLKEAITADDLDNPISGQGWELVGDKVASDVNAEMEGVKHADEADEQDTEDDDEEDDGEDDDEGDDGEDEEDDFLTRELEEAWG